jgi:hypothetical protein
MLRSDLGDDPVREGPQIALGVADYEDILANLRHFRRNVKYRRCSWDWLGQLDQREISDGKPPDDSRKEKLVFIGPRRAFRLEPNGKPSGSRPVLVSRLDDVVVGDDVPAR